MKAYVRMASLGAKIWREHGALEYRECAGDDLDVKFGIGFPKMIKLKPGETVVFAWIVYKSRAHRDRVNAKVMKDPRMNQILGGQEMPFDIERMAYGGFKVLVDA
jgi:uncharacterized protein YbaA (DUF1428 family)